MEESIKKKSISGVIWSALERLSVQGVQFLVMIILARLLSPKDFGLIGMISIFLAVAQSFIDSGFSQALIRKQNRSEHDNSTVFYFNIVISIIVYILLYYISPLIARFYEEIELCKIMRVLCLVVIINSFALVQRAILSSSINFKIQAKASFTAAGLSGFLGIFLAVYGYGVWAIVWQQLCNALTNTIMLWILSCWRPRLLFSMNSFKNLFSFGSRLLVSGIIDTIYSNLYTLIVGKLFSAESLGYLSQADRISQLPPSNIANILSRVAYPLLCKVQDDNETLRKDYLLLMRLSAFVVFPVMCFIAAIAYPLIEVVLGERWRFSATLLIPLCFNMMWYPIAGLNLNLLQVKGRSDLFLRLEIYKKVIGVSVLLISIPFGLVFMCYSRLLSGLLGLYLNAYYTDKILNVGFISQIKELKIYLMSSIFLFVLVFGVTLFLESIYVELIVGLIIALLFYSIVIWRARLNEVNLLLYLFKK